MGYRIDFSDPFMPVIRESEDSLDSLENVSLRLINYHLRIMRHHMEAAITNMNAVERIIADAKQT